VIVGFAATAVFAGKCAVIVPMLRDTGESSDGDPCHSV